LLFTGECSWFSYKGVHRSMSEIPQRTMTFSYHSSRKHLQTNPTHLSVIFHKTCHHLL
jgi:hypothetical protein